MRRLLFWLLLLALLLAGCGQNRALPYVRLDDLDPTLAAGTPGISPRPVLRIGLSTSLSPQETLIRYGPLLDYLGMKLRRHTEVILPRSHTEMLDLVRSGGVHIALLSSYAYVRGQDEFGLEALAVPVYQDQPTHRSYIIVRSYSGLERFGHLKGHTFAYTDPLSAAGRLFPETLVLDLNESIDRFFDRTIYASSDDRAIEALEQGLVDGAAVDSTMYEQALLADPDMARRIRIIASSEPFGAPPVVVHPRLGSELKRELRDILFEMAADEEGHKSLASMGLDRFVAPNPLWYEPVVRMATSVGVRR